MEFNHVVKHWGFYTGREPDLFSCPAIWGSEALFDDIISLGIQYLVQSNSQTSCWSWSLSSPILLVMVSVRPLLLPSAFPCKLFLGSFAISAFLECAPVLEYHCFFDKVPKYSLSLLFVLCNSTKVNTRSQRLIRLKISYKTIDVNLCTCYWMWLYRQSLF